MKKKILLLYLFSICLMTYACGQKGPLVLPKKQFKTNPEIELKEKNPESKVKEKKIL